MKVIFGLYLDGAIWSNEPSALGEVRIGPLGLLSILETYLGLSAISVHPAIRINEYKQRIEEIDCDEAWFHKSFNLDPWATASLLLSWRDELVTNGWQGHSKTNASARLKSLLDIENVNLPLSNGLADRLQLLINYLKDDFSIPIKSIDLVEEINTLPLVWQKILGLLEAKGTSIRNKESTISLEPHNNLTYIQAKFLNNNKQDYLLADDDSLILLKGHNEGELAEHIACWLALKEDTNQVTLICEGDSSILDQALKRYGLPIIGNSSSTPWRQIQQLLPLLIKNLWQPLNIDDLADLLSLDISIFPPWICNILLSAINREPGVGGGAWQKALEQIENYYKKLQGGDEKQKQVLTEEEIKTQLEQINKLLIENRFDPDEGIPEEKVQEICQIYIDRLKGLLYKEKPLIEYINQALLLQELVKGKGKITRIMLEKTLTTIIGNGQKAFGSCQEMGKWKVVKHPGQIIDDSPEVIWWGFNDFNSPLSTNWTRAELQILSVEGVELDDSHNLRQGETQAWLRAFMQTRKRFVGIHTSQINGEIVSPHPFWEAIFYTAKSKNYSSKAVTNYIVRDYKTYYSSKEWHFAGIKTDLAPLSPARPASENTIGKYSVANEENKYNIPLNFSYTQAETLISCPFKWFLDYYANLRYLKSRQRSTDNLLLGNICHRIIERMYKDNKTWQPAAARVEAAKQFDELLPSMAASLLLEGNALTKSRHKNLLVEAVGNLVTEINNLGLIVKEAEEKLEYALKYSDKDYKFDGFADLCLKNDNQDNFILDLKWSYKKDDYHDKVENAGAIQLAIYYKMLKAKETNSSIYTGYYLLPLAKLITNSDLLSEDYIKPTYSMENIWDMTMKTLNGRIEELQKGIIVAKGCAELSAIINSGTTEKEYAHIRREYLADGLIYIEAACNYCDYKFLCGYREVKI